MHAPLVTPAATASVSGGLVSLALDHALAHRYSVLLEGTFRDAGMVTATATRFAEAGYRVEVIAVVTPTSASRLSAEMRSLDAGYPAVGRWTPPQAHETALAGSAGVVAALEALPHVQRMRVLSRKRLLFDNSRTDAGEWSSPPMRQTRSAMNSTAHSAKGRRSAGSTGLCGRVRQGPGEARLSRSGNRACLRQAPTRRAGHDSHSEPDAGHTDP